MRPLVVLSLVIAVVAILLFAVLSVGRDEAAPESPAAPLVTGSAGERPSPIPGAAADASQSGAADEEAPEPIPLERSEIEGALPAFDNALVGTVSDPQGSPLADVQLTLASAKVVDAGLDEMQNLLGDVAPLEGSRTAVTDEQGRFRFRDLEPGRYSLVAKHAEYSRSNSVVGIGYRGETRHDITLEAGHLIQGHVRTTTAQPIPGSTVELLRMNLEALFAPGAQRARPESESQTPDASGRYAFANVEPAQHLHLTARAPGYATRTIRDVVIDPRREVQTHDFRMEKGQAIAGRVLDAEGAPIVDALVTVLGYQEPQSLTAQATTSAEGRFDVGDLVAGSYFVKVEAKGFGTAQLHQVEAPRSDVEVRLASKGVVRGRVVGVEGEPVTSFSATLHPSIQKPNSTAKTFGRADAPPTSFESPDGAFSLAGGLVGPCVVRVEAEGFATTVSQPFELVEGRVTEGIVVELGHGGSIRGRVVDSASGEPVSGAVVLTRDNHYSDNPLMRLASQVSVQSTTSQETRTDSKGRFELELLTPETYQIVVRHPRFAEWVRRDVAVVASQVTDLGDVALDMGSVVRGKVTNELGEPLIGTVVKLSPSRATAFSAETITGSDGEYAILNVPPGSYWLNASRELQNTSPFQNVQDMQSSKVEIEVPRGGEVTRDLHLSAD